MNTGIGRLLRISFPGINHLKAIDKPWVLSMRRFSRGLKLILTLFITEVIFKKLSEREI
jgi:hypothetical protein